MTRKRARQGPSGASQQTVKYNLTADVFQRVMVETIMERLYKLGFSRKAIAAGKQKDPFMVESLQLPAASGLARPFEFPLYRFWELLLEYKSVDQMSSQHEGSKEFKQRLSGLLANTSGGNIIKGRQIEIHAQGKRILVTVPRADKLAQAAWRWLCENQRYSLVAPEFYSWIGKNDRVTREIGTNPDCLRAEVLQDPLIAVRGAMLASHLYELVMMAPSSLPKSAIDSIGREGRAGLDQLRKDGFTVVDTGDSAVYDIGRRALRWMQAYMSFLDNGRDVIVKRIVEGKFFPRNEAQDGQKEDAVEVSPREVLGAQESNKRMEHLGRYLLLQMLPGWYDHVEAEGKFGDFDYMGYLYHAPNGAHLAIFESPYDDAATYVLDADQDWMTLVRENNRMIVRTMRSQGFIIAIDHNGKHAGRLLKLFKIGADRLNSGNLLQELDDAIAQDSTE